MQKRTDAAISLFGDKEAGGIVTLQSFSDYYNGYDDDKGKHAPGYVDMIDKLLKDFPLDEPQIIGEERQKEFIALLGAILCMRNLLVSFDEFGAITEKSSVKYAEYRKTLSKRSGSVLLFRSITFPITVTDGSEGLLRSPESLSLFKVVSFLPFLLIPTLLLSQIFFYRSLRIGKLTGFLVRLIKLGVHG